jgi:ABC-type nitrate/sulfonate/bicarbonate transport system permease component
MKAVLRAAQSGLGVAGFVALWAFAASWLANDVLLPSPFDTFSVLGEELVSARFYRDIGASLRRVLGGYACAAVLAVPLALTMASSRSFDRALRPLTTILRPIPPIAWIPLAILWFGLGDPPALFITALAAFFPIFLNSLDGGLSVESRYRDAAGTLGAGPLTVAVEIVLPAAMPLIATGLRVGLGQAWMAVVTAELIAAQSGLGYLIQANRLVFQTAHVLVGMVTIGVIGAAMTYGFSLLERRVLIPWKER